jgi:hypothetical protein
VINKNAEEIEGGYITMKVKDSSNWNEAQKKHCLLGRTALRGKALCEETGADLNNVTV